MTLQTKDPERSCKRSIILIMDLHYVDQHDTDIASSLSNIEDHSEDCFNPKVAGVYTQRHDQEYWALSIRHCQSFLE